MIGSTEGGKSCEGEASRQVVEQFSEIRRQWGSSAGRACLPLRESRARPSLAHRLSILGRQSVISHILLDWAYAVFHINDLGLAADRRRHNTHQVITPARNCLYTVLLTASQAPSRSSCPSLARSLCPWEKPNSRPLRSLQPLQRSLGPLCLTRRSRWHGLPFQSP